MRTKTFVQIRAALAAITLASAGSAAAVNIAPLGAGIMGVNDAIDADAGTPRFNSGVPSNLIDGNFESRVDSWFGTGPTDQGQGVSFVGINWPATRYESITSVGVTFATFTDGGWFGVNGQGPAAGGLLTAEHLVEPSVQISTNKGVSWFTVPHSSDFLVNLTGHTIGSPALNPSAASARFTLTAPVTAVDGIRVIGTNGGPGDGNGFIGVFEIDVEGESSGDSDADGLPDAWETAHGLSVGANDAAGDPDSDSLTNEQEFNASTHPQMADTDGDGLNDGTETNTHTTSPTSVDTDGDTLRDGAEVNTHKTDPRLVDTDGDGLDDGAEINTHETNPLLGDSDNDGYPDPMEVAQGSDPNNSASIPNNISLLGGRGIMGVKPSLAEGIETEVELFHVGTAEDIVDGNLTTRVDTYNAGDVAMTVSYVGVIWDAGITNTISDVRLTLATFFDGGWFGPNNVGPGAGNALTTNHLTEPTLEITTDAGFSWTAVPHTSDYLTALRGHRVGGGTQPNPTTVTATFTLAQPTNNISGIRLIGTESGTASRGFLGVLEFAALTSSTDVDNDGLDDAWERQNGLSVGTNDAAGDADSDGLTNLQEFEEASNPQLADTDGDGLNDGPEKTQHHTNPLRADTDTDGLSDGAEINTYRTDPLVVDSDSDGFSDGLEVREGSNPSVATSYPDNISAIATAILGTKESMESGPEAEVPHANAGSPGAINDFDLTTRVDTYNGGSLSTVSYVGLIWDEPVTTPIIQLELSLAIFFDGGWFGMNGFGPGSGGTLNGVEHLVEPSVQITRDKGTNWQTVAHTSNYLEEFEGHALPAADFGPPTLGTAIFQFAETQTNINGVRIIGTEGGAASGGFLGVFELAARVASTSAPEGLTLLNANVASGQVRFEFDSTPATSHVVQYKESLSDPAWQILTTINGDGNRKTVTDPANNTRRFYRVANQ